MLSIQIVKDDEVMGIEAYMLDLNEVLVVVPSQTTMSQKELAHAVYAEVIHLLAIS